jgi:hypothetical protein
MPAFCSQCGTALKPDAKFCEECGTPSNEKQRTQLSRQTCAPSFLGQSSDLEIEWAIKAAQPGSHSASYNPEAAFCERAGID